MGIFHALFYPISRIYANIQTMKKTYPCKVDIFIDFCKSNTELQKFILDMRKSLYEKSLVNIFDGEYYTEIFIKAFHTCKQLSTAQVLKFGKRKVSRKMEVLR